MWNNVDFIHLLENMKDTQFQLNHDEVLEVVYKAYLTNETLKIPITNRIIMSAFSKSEGFKIEGNHDQR